jgi:hypothetical protein
VGGAGRLELGGIHTKSSDHRPVVTEALGPEWGYDLDDVNLAIQNLVDDVRNEERGYAAHI